MAASNTVTDDVRNQVIYKIFNKKLQYSCDYCILKIDEKLIRTERL